MFMKAGEVVEVRSREEILATLDEEGCLDKLPFMPEMLKYCGQTFRVASSAHKTCDTANRTGGRRMRRTVHLEGLRCDGAAHGGCQAGCLIFWKYEWLRRAGQDEGADARPAGLSEEQLLATTVANQTGDGQPIYRCQVTRLYAATEALSGWDPRQYVRDIWSGNSTVGRLVRALLFALFRRLVQLGIGYRLLVKTYNGLQRLIGGSPYPFVAGNIPVGAPTPTGKLDLNRGELVRIKPHEAILATLNTRSENRGMRFDAEMVPFCGTTHRVEQRVDRIIEESTGKMLEMKNPCIVLEDVYCKSAYSDGRLLCPRAIYSYWRESWLERADTPPTDQST